ncbi:MAG: GIY-YIG nuclease family protein [Terriglobia bacterium]
MPFQLNSLCSTLTFLRSARDGEWYTGATSDLRARVQGHIQGRVHSTRNRTPLELVYYEACLSQADAFRRERYLKTGRGKRYLRQRLTKWLASLSPQELERHY